MKEERALERRPDFFDVFPRRFFDWFAAPAEFHDFKVEDYVEDGTYVLRAEIPGIDPDKDVDIHVRDHMVELRVERTEEKTTGGKDRYRSEFRYGSFTRTVPLPLGASEDDVKATYKDGILDIRVPMPAELTTTARKIPVSPG